MTDQCKHCILRGDIEICKATECSHHENWYAVQQQSEIDQLKQQRDELLAAIKDFRYEMKFKHAIDEANIIGASSRIVLQRVDKAIKNADGE